MGGHGLDWSGLGHGQVVGSCKCCNEPSGSIKWEFRDYCGTICISRRTLLHGVSYMLKISVNIKNVKI